MSQSGLKGLVEELQAERFPYTRKSVHRALFGNSVVESIGDEIEELMKTPTPESMSLLYSVASNSQLSLLLRAPRIVKQVLGRRKEISNFLKESSVRREIKKAASKAGLSFEKDGDDRVFYFGEEESFRLTPTDDFVVEDPTKALEYLGGIKDHLFEKGNLDILNYFGNLERRLMKGDYSSPLAFEKKMEELEDKILGLIDRDDVDARYHLRIELPLEYGKETVRRYLRGLTEELEQAGDAEGSRKLASLAKQAYGSISPWMLVPIGAGIIGAILGAIYLNQQHQNDLRDVRIHQLSPKIPDQVKAGQFDDKYHKFADENGNVYTDDALGLAEVYNINVELADHGVEISGGDLSKIPTVNISKINGTVVAELFKNAQDPRRGEIDPITLTEDAAKVCLPFVRDMQRPSQFWTVSNGTAYFGSAVNLMSEIGADNILAVVRKLGEVGNINRDFANPRVHRNLLELVKRVPGILKYPKDCAEGAREIEEIIYKPQLDKIKGDDYVWDNSIIPSVVFIEKQRDRGRITAPDGEIDVIHAMLQYVDIKTGKFSGYTKEDRLASCVENVTPDESGEIPIEWLADLVNKHYIDREKTVDWIGEKWSPYDIAIKSAYDVGPGLAGDWPNCAARYKADLEKIMEEHGDNIQFIIGEPYFLRGQVWQPNGKSIVPIIEQAISHYTDIIAYTLGVKSRYISANPPSGTPEHSEPALYQDGEWFSFFGWKDHYADFKKDYVGKTIEPDLKMTGIDGESIYVKLDEN